MFLPTKIASEENLCKRKWSQCIATRVPDEPQPKRCKQLTLKGHGVPFVATKTRAIHTIKYLATTGQLMYSPAHLPVPTTIVNNRCACGMKVNGLRCDMCIPFTTAEFQCIDLIDEAIGFLEKVGPKFVT